MNARTSAPAPQILDTAHARLSRHILTDGYAFELDLAASHGSWLVAAHTGDEYLDLYTSFASAPLGFNPDCIVRDPAFLDRLARVAANKPANPDLYTTEFAEFVDVFVDVLGDPELPHLFFVEGGALAVENALKCAFDWKSRRNEQAGRAVPGSRVLHLTRAFHGRSGYTLSLTNTEPGKTDRFPRFDWPRIDVPAMRFPVDAYAGELREAEGRALRQAEAAFAAHPHDIACFIAEPIQGEGGDNHLRAEFLLAMQELCLRHDALFILDEVQTGVGLTGSPWAYQQLGLAPDIVAFSKKAQVGGIMAGRRVNEVADNVFRVSGRISSTWGGGLADMVRSTRLLETIRDQGLIPRAARLGTWLLEQLSAVVSRHSVLADNARGRGLMCALDLADPALRDRLIRELVEHERVLMLPSGDRSVRMRPALNIGNAELGIALRALDRALGRLD